MSLLTVLIGFSQEPSFRNYTVEDGLPSSECYQILQDSQGYMWIATDRGVSRYDGYSFQNFTKENGLPENCVLRMYLDSKGRIWFGCLSGKMAIYENGKMRPLTVNAQIQEQMSGGIINSMCMSGDTLKVAYLYSMGTIELVYRNGKFRIIGSRQLRNGAFVEQLPNKEIFFGWASRGKNTTPQYIDFYRGSSRTTFKSVFYAPVYKWFKAYYAGNKLYLISDRRLKILSLIGKVTTEQLFDSRLLALRIDRSGSSPFMCVCTVRGLLCYNNDQFTSPAVVLLKDKTVSDFYRDREGGFWAATLNSGIYYAKNVGVQNFKTEHRLFSMLKHRGQLLLGFEKGRIGFFDGDSISERNLSPDMLDFPVKKIFRYLDDDHILVRLNGGIVYSLSGKKFVRSLHGIPINDFVYDPLTKKEFFFNQYGIAEYGNGVFKNAWRSKGYRIVINCASPAANGKILVGTNYGLAEYDTYGKRLRFRTRSLPDILHIEKGGQALWLATKENGVQIERKGQRFRLTSASGLTSDYCCHIYLENEATAWISTNKGLTKVTVTSWSPFQYTCFQYSEKDGLICDELVQTTGLNGKIVVAGAKGLSVFDKTNMVMPEYRPTVHLSAFSVNGKSYPVRSYYRMNGTIRNLVLDFRGICFRKEGKLMYRYRVKEIDTNWKTTVNTSLEYNKIPYGRITFELQAQSTSGNWDTPVRKIVLFSPVPFAETTLFRLVLVLGIGLIIWFSVSRRIRVIKRRAFDREQLYRKASEMEMKFLTGQMNPHFTFNAMNSIQHFMLQNDLLKAQNYLAKYSRLIRKVLENNMHEYVDLNSELELLRLYVEIESMRFSRKIGFQINCNADLVDSCQIPPMFIQPYIENAIWHGLFDNAVENGLLSLTITEEGNYLECVVEDNGIGREKAQQKKAAEDGQQSLGMLITRRRLDQLPRSERNLSEPSVVDLYNADGEPRGTQVTFYLPYIRKTT